MVELCYVFIYEIHPLEDLANVGSGSVIKKKEPKCYQKLYYYDVNVTLHT